MKYKLLVVLFVFAIFSCGGKAKVISPTTSNSNQLSNGSSTGVFDNKQTKKTQTADSENTSTNVHTVKVLEVLPTDKYVYLRVNENEEEYWIATGKQDVEIGSMYFLEMAY